MESEQDASVPASFQMFGGTIDNGTKTDDFIFLKENGGAIHIVNGAATMEGGTIKNSSAENGGAVYVTGGDFIMKSGSITNNTASKEGGAIYVQEGNIIIGLEECKGKEDSHSHPVIKDNIATDNGGGISITGGEVTMYCGNLISNKATLNQSGNSISQHGGIFNVEGGNLGIGIYIGENATFNDRRDGIYQVTYHAIYDEINEVMTTEVNSNEKLTLPKENQIENTNFIREGLYLIGWSTNSTSDEGYMVVGSKIYVTESTDLYAVLGTEEPIATYNIFIPDTLNISSVNKTGTLSISARLKYFTNVASLNVELEEKGNLQLDDANITYKIKDSSNNNEFERGDILATFTSVSQTEKSFRAEVTSEGKYAGEYIDTLTFKIIYNDGSQ